MSKIHDISDRYKTRIDKTNNCAGCQKEFEDQEEFTTVVLPNSFDETEVTHIGLCDKCYKVSQDYGVL